MTLTATDYDFQADPIGKSAAAGPVLESAHWGYVIRDPGPRSGASLVTAAASRFLGVILLMAALGLWVLPDTTHGTDVFGMKLAAMVMFTVFGGYLSWAGGVREHLEFHVDTHRCELRIGRRGLRGAFRLTSRLSFNEIASVYLLRSKDHERPTRLFLRLAGRSDALEVASGPEGTLDDLRARLAKDLSQSPMQPIELRLKRHGVVAT